MQVRTPLGLRSELAATVEDLAAFGEKRCGSEAGARAADYLRTRFLRLGLADVREQPFAFPRHDVTRAEFSVAVAGTPRDVAWAVLEACGGGVVEADVMSVGWATPEQLATHPSLAGKIALVDRNPLYHRSTQYYNAAAAGAAAVIFASSAPANLPQVGSVRRAWEAAGPIAALTVGGVDAHVMRAALDANQPVRAKISIAVDVGRGAGKNVLGDLPGRGDRSLVVGAHYDTWFAGSSDNGGGVAAMLALAERRARRPPSRHGLVFVAWDGEELALYGGYQLMRHYARATRPPLAVIDFETPSAVGAQAYGLARSNHAPLEDAIADVGLDELFALNVPMELVAELFGGIIPTDVQGLYRSGTPAVATAVDAPYYHTRQDSPDKVDYARLEETVLHFDRALDVLLDVPAERFAARDPALWRLNFEVAARGEELVVVASVRDGNDRRCTGADVGCVLFADDFFAVAEQQASTDLNGDATFIFAGAARDARPRCLHLSAGIRWPLVEAVHWL
jgi:hypothetical protein